MSKSKMKSCGNCGYGSRLLKVLDNPLECIRCKQKDFKYWTPIKKEKPQAKGVELKDKWHKAGWDDCLNSGIEVEIKRDHLGFFLLSNGHYISIPKIISYLVKQMEQGQTQKFILTRGKV